MNPRNIVGSIRRIYNSGSEGSEGPEFIHCVDGRDPQMHKVWCFSSGGITREVHPSALVDVSAGLVVQFSSDYLTEDGRRIPIVGQISINGSVEYLGIPDFHRVSGPFWDDNLLAPCYSWGFGGTNTNQNWRIQPGVPYKDVSIALHVAIPARPT